MKPKEGDLKVWHIPQVPSRRRFEVLIGTLREGKLLLDVLANYDIYQYENRIKPDYSNAQGLMVYEDGEWTDWYSQDGEDIHAWTRRIDRIGGLEI